MADIEEFIEEIVVEVDNPMYQEIMDEHEEESEEAIEKTAMKRDLNSSGTDNRETSNKQLMDKIRSLEMQVNTCLENKNLLLQFIGKINVLETELNGFKESVELRLTKMERDLRNIASNQANSSVVVKTEFATGENSSSQHDHDDYFGGMVEDCEPFQFDDAGLGQDSMPNVENDPDFIPEETNAKSAKAKKSVRKIPRLKVRKKVYRSEKFKCLYCSKEFLEKSKLRDHQLCHSTGLEPFGCSECDVQFKHVEDLNNHRQIHFSASSLPLPDIELKVPHSVVSQESEQGPGPSSSSPPKQNSERKSSRVRIKTWKLADAEDQSSTGMTDASESEVEPIEDTHLNILCCKLCPDKVFDNTELLLQHYKSEHGNSLEIFKCQLCSNGSFAILQDLADHYTKEHPTPDGIEPPVILGKNCPECERVLRSSWDLDRHLLEAHGIGTAFECDFCQQKYTRRHKLKKHQEKVHGKISEHLLVVKRKRTQQPKEFCCPHCPRIYYRKGELEGHIPGCLGLKPFHCDECGKDFVNKKNLRNHIAGVHQKARQQLCPICGKSICGASNLRTHILSHYGEKKFPCQTCGRKFLRRKDRDVHEKTHTGERDFTCTICAMAFSKHDTLKRHMYIHTGDKPYKCDLCEKAFTRPGQLASHKIAHEKGAVRHPVDPNNKAILDCPHCGKQFSTKFTLRRHIYSHTGENPDEGKSFFCEICDRPFRLKGALNLHKKKAHHGNNDPENNSTPAESKPKPKRKRRIKKEKQEVKAEVAEEQNIVEEFEELEEVVEEQIEVHVAEFVTL